MRETHQASPAAEEDLAAHRAVPTQLPANVVFFDIENVFVTSITDLASSHVVQVGAVDGHGREMVVSVKPPLSFADVARAGDFFVTNGFNKFFVDGTPAFAAAWPGIAQWLYDPAQGRSASQTPVFLVGHNIARFDLPRIDQVSQAGRAISALTARRSCLLCSELAPPFILPVPLCSPIPLPAC